MDYVLRRLLQIATRRGLRGEHWAWFALAGVTFLFQRARRRADPVVFSRRMAPGDQFLVSLRKPNGDTTNDLLDGDT
jgi:hypothetical protein